MVDSIQVESKSVRAPMLTADTEEVGTDWPTKVAPDVKAAYAALTARDVEFSWPAFTERVGTVFTAFHDAWSSQALDEMRPLLTDNLLETQRYWLCAYRAAGLRNISADARIASIEIARVTADKYFDAITVRVYATNLDYTVDNNDKVVSGSRSRARQYSEYWTFVRGLRRSSTGAECPNCGAPATEAGMTGRCGACGVKVQHSSFDWVLSRIEQDEAYQP